MPEDQHKCPRRQGAPFVEPEYDTWNNRDGYPACSYCGSLHPDTFMQAVRDGVVISGTDKSYKAYIRELPVSGTDILNHAKFYYMHLSQDQKGEFVHLYNERKIVTDEFGLYTLPFFMKELDA